MARRSVRSASKHQTLWYTRCPVPTAFGLAVRLGWFEQEFARDGIKWLSLAQAPDRSAHESHFSHSLPDSFRHGGNIPAIWARAQGADSRLIGLSWTESPHLIITLPDSGIRTVADLRGRKLGLARLGDKLDIARLGALRTYEVALASAGVGLAEVRLTDIPIGRGHFDEAPVAGKAGEALWNALSIRAHQREELFALIRGEVDAIFAESAFGIDAALFLGAHVVYDVRQHPDQRAHSNNAIPHTLTVSGRLLQERPDLVARVLAQVLRAASWARSHHEDAVRFVAAESGSAEETVELTYGPALSGDFEVNLSPENLEAIRERKEFVLRHGVIRSDFALEDWVDRRPLEEANRILAQREESHPAASTPWATAATTLA